MLKRLGITSNGEDDQEDLANSSSTSNDSAELSENQKSKDNGTMTNDVQPPANHVTIVQGFQGVVMTFDTDDVPTWFQHFESILRIHHVPETDKYDHLMAVLTKPAIAPVSISLKAPPATEEEKYPWLKKLLIEGHGKSTKERLRQLLAGERIGDRKPSQFLARLVDIAPSSVDDEIVREVWWKELPQSCRAILSTMQSATPAEMAKIADAIHAEVGSGQISAVRPAPPVNELQELKDLIKEMRKDIQQLQQNGQHRRSRSHSRFPQNQQRRSQSRQGSSNRGENEICYYHQKFKEQSKCCRPPCAFEPSSKN